MQIVPENTFFRTWFAWHYYRAGQYGKAREQLEKAIEIEPNYWDLYFRLAQLLDNIGRPTEAREVFESAIKRMPDSAGLWYQYGRFSYTLKGDIDAAVERWHQAVDLDSSYGDAYNMLAYAYAKKDDFDNALASVQNAIEVSPDNLNYIDTRADILYSFGYLDEAIESYRQFLSQLPNSMNTIRELGDAATFARKYDLADSAYNTLAQNTSVEYRGWGQFCLTSTLRHQGKFRETVAKMISAEKIIRQEVGASDQLGGLYWNRAQIYWEWLQVYDKALEDLDSLRQVGNQIDSRGAISSAELGRPLVYALAGKYDSCDYYWQRLDTATKDEDRYTWQGYIQMAKGNADSAVACFRQSSIIRPPSTVDRAWLGMAYLANGQVAEAVKHLERSVYRYDWVKGVFPGYAVWYRYQLARAYEAAGRKDEAINQYETFLDIWKNADDGLESVEDAKKRLARLKGTI
jgi:tetratricopeptide (TPR) repeat protein